MRAEHSRSVRLAATATGESESSLERRLNAARISVSVDPSLPGSLEIAALLLETLRRGLGHIELDPRGLSSRDLMGMAVSGAGVSKSGKISVGSSQIPGSVYVHVGYSAPPGVLCVMADGHGVRLASNGEGFSQQRAPTALGIAFAAASAAGEIFKRTAAVDTSRCVLPERLAFCPVSLEEDLEVAPIEYGGDIELILVGLGAVGTAVARILGALRFGPARALLIDPETFAIENLGTYTLGTLADLDRPKVELAAEALEGWSVQILKGNVQDAIGLIDTGELPWLRTAICGLDSIEARRSAQGLWPDRLIDAATGDTSVGVHETMADGGCLRCFFPEPTPSRSAAELLSEELGLPMELLKHGEKSLEESQLHGLTEGQRRRLAPHLGKPICGLASAVDIGAGENDSYRPSVPFVSQQAACLAVGRLLAARSGMPEMPNAVQYNAMIGPQQMTRLSRLPRPNCYCQQRAETIRAVRNQRSARVSV